MAAVSPKDLINALISAVESDPNIFTALVEARNKMVQAMLKPNGLTTILESSKNGVSYKVLADVPESLRLVVFNTAIGLIERNQKPTSITQARFQ